MHTAMTNATIQRRPPHAGGFDLSPTWRALVAISGGAMTLAIAIALARWALGMTIDHSSTRHLAVIVHVATVIPAVPLGLYLMLTRKGSAQHKLLGRIWIALMVTTALAAIFIRHINDGQFSFIHLFVPLTLIGAWQTVASARRGELHKHRNHLLGLYLAALIIPGIFAFAGNRLMGAWLFS
jgi:uncharacterized membrane protein